MALRMSTFVHSFDGQSVRAQIIAKNETLGEWQNATRYPVILLLKTFEQSQKVSLTESVSNRRIDKSHIC